LRVGELSGRTGVSVASIKYYLREGMLAPGERTGPNQASYGEAHVRRLRLVRALLDVGGLSVAATKEVLAAVDDHTLSLHEVLGVTQDALVSGPEPIEDDATARARERMAALVARRGWWVDGRNPGWRAAIDILATVERLGHPELADAVDLYAEAMDGVAREEVGSVVAGAAREDAVEGAITGIVLGGALLSAVRAMAQENASARRLSTASAADHRPGD
jgi:DNA-binding transcriptional MerR regulator